MQRDGSIALAFGGMAAMTAALGIGRFVYTPILPSMIGALGWTKSNAGLIASANFLGYLLGAVLAGLPFAVRRPRFWLLASLAISAISTAAMAVPSDIASFAVLRFIGGAASAFVIVCASTLVLERLTLSGRGPLSAIHFAGVGFGIVISAIAVSAMLASGVGWRNLWIGSGAIALLATIVAATMIPEAHRAAAPPQQGAPRSGPSGIGTMTLAYGLFGFGYVITTTFLIAIIRLTPAVHAFEPWAWMVVGIAAIPSVTIWVWLGKRIGVMNAFAVACLIEAVGVAASVEWMTMTGICLSALLLGGTFLGVTALGLIAAPMLSAGNSHQAIGRMTASFAIGQMAGPTLAGFLSEHLGDFRVASLIAAGALVISAALAISTSRIFARSQIVVAKTSERSPAGGIAAIQPIRCSS